MSETFSQIIALPLDHPRHVSFRNELGIVHAEHGCRYYLSLLTGRDYFHAHRDAFEADFVEYLVANASPEVTCWSDLVYLYDFALPFLCDKFHVATKIPRNSQATNEERALILLLTHPEWDDAIIIDKLKTTPKQFARWPMFQLARREQDRSRVDE
ncbi:MAG: hypothetical protein NXI22_12555 [bacterium]|nr:hypothetical protein [bacterium]